MHGAPWYTRVHGAGKVQQQKELVAKLLQIAEGNIYGGGGGGGGGGSGYIGADGGGGGGGGGDGIGLPPVAVAGLSLRRQLSDEGRRLLMESTAAPTATSTDGSAQAAQSQAQPRSRSHHPNATSAKAARRLNAAAPVRSTESPSGYPSTPHLPFSPEVRLRPALTAPCRPGRSSPHYLRHCPNQVHSDDVAAPASALRPFLAQEVTININKI